MRGAYRTSHRRTPPAVKLQTSTYSMLPFILTMFLLATLGLIGYDYVATVDGKCSQYTDGYGTCDNNCTNFNQNHIMDHIMEMLTLQTSIRRSMGQIIMPSSTHCPLTPGYCMDSEGAETF
ncbi:hypothetical protein G5I_00058 [Acromyrmex echinatior]|uniref:Uncharacterized protein n=1 Tax=Acromyrmex echinatior TaxID=103372 RepID=F4W3V8_ACREC|nr:hypothetical protein G5I_00058 [Acromyrmex echinatior]